MKLIENLPFDLLPVIGARAQIGVVVLATDYTLEHEFRRVFASLPGVDFYCARISNSNTISPETLAAMERKIPQTVSLILPGESLDVVAYGCTSATTVLGEETVFDCVREAQPLAKCTTPITSAFAAFDTFGAKRIAVLTPYRQDVNELVARCITDAGFDVPVFGSFNEEQDPVVARIDQQSISSAIKSLTANDQVDMVFVSCTSVRFLEAVAEVEQELDIPITTSNHAMAWHCLRLAGVDDLLPELGRLYEQPLPAQASASVTATQ